MIIRQMSSTQDLEHVESVAKQSGCDRLLLDYVREILLSQGRDIEPIDFQNLSQKEIRSSLHKTVA